MSEKNDLMDGLIRKEFTIERGLKVAVTFRVSDGPSWLGGRLKWSATPLWNTRKKLGAGYSLTQAGGAHEIQTISTSITGSTMSWLAHLTGKRRKQLQTHTGLRQFVMELDEWLIAAEEEQGGAV